MSNRLPAAAAEADEVSPRYFGWRVAAACFLMALCTWGFAFYGHAVYLAELQRLHGWSAAMISGASTLTYLAGAVLLIVANDSIERLGLRLHVLMGALLLGLSLVLLALVDEPWELYAVYLLMSVAWLSMGTPTITIILSYWFVQRRGLAISLALNGASFGGILIAPLLLALIAFAGFTYALLIAALLLTAILVPAVLLWIERPPVRSVPGAQAAPPQAWTRRTALRNPAFWSASGPFAVALMAQVGFIVHQVALLEPLAGRAYAGVAVVVTTAMAVIGRIVLGAFVDRVDPRRASALSLLSQAVALLAIATTSDPILLVVWSGVFGFSVGNVITLPPLILHREFPAASFGLLVGLSTSIIALVAALGPAFVGVVHDATGGYMAGLLACAVLDAVAAALVLLWRLAPEGSDAALAR